ncbi:hypothetical protein N9B94_04185 [Verrucomicrobia bacterium]|nr:hypothetical protein [Verrucomicrobiota bacterium]
MDDEKYYDIVGQELRENRINDALWTKSIAKSMGDENKTKAVYIQLRVDQLIRDEQEAKQETTPIDASDQAWEEPEESHISRHNKQALMQWGKFLGEVIIFVVGCYAIWKWLIPWVRSMRSNFL